MQANTQYQARRGFTLVELSIVLVIIGLIIGGVLVGQDLIKAAEVRATVGQYEKYNAAVNTFRSKYNGIPGDLRNASAFLTGGVDGNGNGLIEDADADLTIDEATGEITYFWHQLSLANLIDGSFDGVQTGGTLGETYPFTKMNRGGWLAYNDAGMNYFQIGAAGEATTTIVTANNLNPTEAYNIDLKVDDGLPNTGQTTALGGTAPNTAATAGATAADCTSAATAAGTYNLTNTALICQLKMRMM